MIELPGVRVEPEALTIPKAKDLARYLASGLNTQVELVEVLQETTADVETVVFDARIEVSQTRVHPILPTERLAVTFAREDQNFPAVLSLRENFPAVPHLSLRAEEFPRGLCLYDISYEEVKLRWTPASFTEWIREWLSQTADGRLHQEDQPLEPILLGGFLPLLLPAAFFDGSLNDGAPKTYGVVGVGGDDNVPTAFRLVQKEAGPQRLTHLATVMITGVREHGAIRRNPHDLGALIELCQEVSFDLRAQLRQAIPEWRNEVDARRLHLILVILFPKTRTADAPVSAYDTLAFVLQAGIDEIGEHLGLWMRSPDGSLGALLGEPADNTKAVPVCILNPMVALTKERAALLNGVQPVDASFLLVGVGAFGSKLLENFIRKGFGKWRVVDRDVLLPHNAARHLLPSQAAGYPKALGVRTLTQTIYEGVALSEVMVGNVMRPGEKADELLRWFSDSEAIIDCSADVPTARHFALSAPGSGRRLSAFLNPTGEDLVILLEDKERAVRLDELEMQYYALLLHEPELAQHLAAAASRVRYGRSCRDLSAVLSNDAITRNAAIASRFIADALAAEGASIRVWKNLEGGGVGTFEWPAAQGVRLAVGGYTVVWNAEVMNAIRELRTAKLPRETGGALLGQWDHSRKILYLVATTPAPIDSLEEPTGFVRGVEGLQKLIDNASDLTGGQVAYIGEWHSHPNGYGTRASSLDQKLYAWLKARLLNDSLPPVMLIVESTELRWLVDEAEEVWSFPT